MLQIFCFVVRFFHSKQSVNNMTDIISLAEYDYMLKKEGKKLILVDFYATWCPPCIKIAPLVESLVEKHNIVLLKVDVDQVRAVVEKEGVTAMPTFVFYRNLEKVDQLRGADPNQLEEKILEHKCLFIFACTKQLNVSLLKRNFIQMPKLIKYFKKVV